MISRKNIIIWILVMVTSVWILFFYPQGQSVSPQSVKKAEKIQKLNTYINLGDEVADISWQIETFWKEITDYRRDLNAWDLEKAIQVSDVIITNVEKTTSINSEEKNIKRIAAKYLKVNALVNYWNYFYKEKEYAARAEEELQAIQKIDDDLFDSPYGMYFVWYAKEIQKEYDKAVKYYLLWITYAGEDKKVLSILNNQIGHVYDLMWDSKKAYEFYIKAYALYPTNVQASLNIARKLVRLNKLKESIPYFVYALDTLKNSLLKAEIYYDLSSVYLYSQEDPDKKFAKSLEFAKKSIESNAQYPYWYIAVARIYLLTNKNTTEIEKLLNTSISLNKNSSLAYEWLGLYYQSTGIYGTAIKNFLTSLSLIDTDVVLMENEKNSNKARINYLLSVTLALWKNKTMSLKHLKDALIYKDTYTVLLFIDEIKRKSYWKFSIFAWDSEFEKLASVFLK